MTSTSARRGLAVWAAAVLLGAVVWRFDGIEAGLTVAALGAFAGVWLLVPQMRRRR
jgi:hypothetical protein